MTAPLALALAVALAFAPAATPGVPAVDATLQVVAFHENGERARDVVVAVAGAPTRTTNANGRVVVALAPGVVAIAIGAPGGIVIPPITARAGELLDLIVTVDEHGRVVAADAPFDPADLPTPSPSAPSAPSVDDTTSDGRVIARELDVVVVDAVDGAALGGVRVFVAGRGFAGETARDGSLKLALAANGDEEAAQVSFVLARYSPRVVVVPAEQTSLLVELLPAASDLSEMTVRAPRIDGNLREAVAERRQQRQVVDVIGSDQMKRTGDGDAASALKRAAGLTVIGGRYVVVRGLGERYATTLLDGATLPSPEPERRVVPLDMFPTGVLSSVVVQKSWSPDLPGEFGGGAIQLRTRRMPERRFLDVSLGASGALGHTFAPTPMYRGGSLDALGFDDGTRALPSDLRDASSNGVLGERSALSPDGYAPKELERFGESLSRVYSTSEAPLPPSLSLGVTFGDRWSLPAFDVGVLAALSWSQDWSSARIERHRYALGANGALTPLEDSIVSATDRNVALGGLLGVGVEADGHALQSTTFVQRISDDEVRVLDGYDADVNTDVRATRLRWVERTLFSERLSGEHALPVFDSVLSWRYAFALAARDEPDQRETRVDRDVSSGDFLLSDRPEGNQRLFSTLGDHSHDAEVAWKLPFASPLVDEESLLHVGVAGSAKVRDVQTRRYTLAPSGAAASDPALRRQTPEEIFAPQNIGADGYQIAESTRKTDNYDGEALVGATFAVVTLPLPARWTLSGGARLEASHIGVSTFELFNASAAPVDARLDTLDVLPALAATWAFADDMQLRLAGALTVARPELRELSPAVFSDVTAGRSRFGNPELKATSIAHLDARYEWYLSATDAVSVAAFGKRFTNPIERTITAGSDQSVTYENAPAATNLGLEVEARVAVPFIDVLVDGVYVGGNGALIWSNVTLPADGIQTSNERALEGQSPWVLNAELGWAGDGVTATLLYNVFGARIRDVGVLGVPDVYEQPFHQLDAVVTWKMPWWGLSLTGKCQNLLDGETLLTQGGQVIERSRRGPQVALTVGASL